LSLEPIQHIGIDARGDLALARAIEVARLAFFHCSSVISGISLYQSRCLDARPAPLISPAALS